MSLLGESFVREWEMEEGWGMRNGGDFEEDA